MTLEDNKILEGTQNKYNENNEEKAKENVELKSICPRLYRSKSFDNEEIKDIIEFDEAIQSLIKDECLTSRVEDGTVATFIGTEDSCNSNESDLSNNERKKLPVAVDDSDNKFSSVIKAKSPIRRSNSLSFIKQDTKEDNDNDAQEKSLHVKFGDVEEREYSLALGDHPDVCGGPPIALSWNYAQKEKTDILTYEAQKQFPRRSTRSLHVSKMHREFLLREKGYSRREINVAIHSVSKIVRDRKITNDFSKYQVAAHDARVSIKDAAKSIGKSFKLF